MAQFSRKPRPNAPTAHHADHPFLLSIMTLQPSKIRRTFALIFVQVTVPETILTTSASFTPKPSMLVSTFPVPQLLRR